MKVLKLKTNRKQTATEKFISDMLKNDWDAFKATSKQFLRNNQAYAPTFSGFTA